MYKKGKIKLICPTCKSIFYRWRCQVEEGAGKFCSRKCVRRTNKWKKERSEECMGSKNPFWGGRKKEKNGCSEKSALHHYLHTRIPKPKYCKECGKVPPIDLANISQKYKRDLSDWEWLCRRCHMLKDGRLKKFVERKRKTKPPIICKVCGEEKKHDCWGMCSKCYERVRYYVKRREDQTLTSKNITMNKAIKIVKKRFCKLF